MPDITTIYTICIHGHLDDAWSEWFDGMTVARHPSGDTTLTGPVCDQAALHGLLAKIRDLGLPLVAVSRMGPELPPSGCSDPRPANDPPSSAPAPF